MSSLLGIRKDHHHKKPIKLFENPSLKRIGLGQAKLKNRNRKRKAQYDLNISPTLSLSPPKKQLTTFSNGIVSKGSGQNSVEGMGRASKELNKQKPKTNSVKGKKEFTRNRALLSSPIIAASDKTSFSTSADWSTRISKLRTELNGEFKFGTNLDSKMGGQCGWADSGDSEGDYRGNLSSPNTPHGLVQCQTSNNMEASIPSNVDECSPGLPAIDRSGVETNGRTMV